MPTLKLGLSAAVLPQELLDTIPKESPIGSCEDQPQLPFSTDFEDDLSLYMNDMGQKNIGRKEKLWYEVLGPLTLEDLRAFNEIRSNGKGKVPTAEIKRIRTIHHQIAQYMAQGLKNVEIAAVLGVSQSRLTLISNDPAFEELLEFYTEGQRKLGVSITERLNTISTLAMEEIQDRLLDQGETISTSHLLKLLETTLDRSGHQPGGQTKRDSGAGASQDEIARLKAETRKDSQTKVLSRSEYIPKGEEDGED